jgi:soluble lytic murein transglycosylase
MQLMPATAKSTARSLGLDYDLGSLIARPDYNVQLGSTYLKQMVDRFDGHYIKAIASYNAGPGRVVRWVAEHGDPSDPSVDVIDWIERIPFSETRNYVQRVLEALHVYRERLAGHRDQAAALAALGTGAQKVWCVYSCGVLLDRQQAALRNN